MKQIILFVLALSGAGTVLGQSALRISLSDRTPITVAVDGRYFNTRGQSVTVGDLPTGRHWVQIYVATEGSRNVRENMVYEGKVKTYGGQTTLVTYDYNADNVAIAQQDMNYQAPPAMPGNPGNNGAPGYSNNNGGYDNGNNNNDARQNTPPPAQNDNGYSDNNNQPAASPAASPVSDDVTTEGKAKLAKLQKKVAAKNTDTEKLKALQNALKTEMINCAQVRYMMDWFNFESTKVEFAEWAYDHVTDPQNFATISDMFMYSNYKDELDNFVKSKK